MKAIRPAVALVCLVVGCSAPAPSPSNAGDAARSGEDATRPADATTDAPRVPDGAPAPDVVDARATDASLSDASVFDARSTDAADASVVDAPATVDEFSSDAPAALDAACPLGLSLCSESCVDLAVTSAHCGSCGTTCPAGQSCVAGACVIACAAPATNCNGVCVPTRSDVTNCGGCGQRCSPAHATPGCAQGSCTIATCDEGFGDCDGNPANGCEVDLTASTGHCGTCEHVCAATTAGTVGCAMGACTLTCPSNFADCDSDRTNGCETDLRVNPAHCASCDNVCPTPSGSAPACMAGVCGHSDCGAGHGDCDGNAANGCETDVTTSLTHCGACGNACARSHATAVCTDGACGVLHCDAGFGDCDGDTANGCETDLGTSATHCGTCDTACSTANGVTPNCVAGVCGIASCPAGTADCDANVANGCETNTLTDPFHCGACGTLCRVDHASATCSAGQCGTGRCNTGYGNCDGMDANGCETDLASTSNCATCGYACQFTNAAASCTAQHCALGTCNTGYGNCDANPANGCETDITTSAANCGSCGHACGANEVCSSGVCVLTCPAGRTNCSGACVNLQGNPSNCGTCGTVCTVANGSPACSAGICRIGYCADDHANCDANTANGCETSITTVANCGMCGRVCPAVANGSAGCTGQQCGIASCNAGYADCDGNAANGCETNTASSVTNCGACGAACNFVHAQGVCSAGTCQINACAATGLGGHPYRNCDNDASNGCETTVTTDVNNCGSCGNVCPARPHASGTGCLQGGCFYGSCNTDYRDCNGQVADGCETHISNDLHNCGRCGHSCGTVVVCRSGTCGGI